MKQGGRFTKMGAKILIVDDEPSLRKTFSAFLTGDGHEVVTAGSYKEAVQQTEQTDFDLIFSDIQLGGQTGIDLLRSLKEKEISCPVIMVTGFPNMETATEAVRLGAHDYLSKPVFRDDLLKVTRSALGYRKLQKQTEIYQTHIDAILRCVEEGIISVNQHAEIVSCNRAAREICGLPTDWQGRPFQQVVWDKDKLLCGILQETLAGRREQQMTRKKCTFGEERNRMLTLATAPLLDRQGDFLGAVLTLRDETRLDALERDLDDRRQFQTMVGKSAEMQSLYRLIEDLADLPSTVLITGETGTGKELVAEALHLKSEQKTGPLIKVNCVALADNLLESELFGHVRGAFTGAVKDRKGRFELAQGGTILLDEIGDISPQMQVRLLRVLQEKQIERVGDSTPIRVNVRVVAATNQNLAEKVSKGEFREDLYYRLKVMTLHLPPLRDRLEDLPLLQEHFRKRFNRELSRNVTGFSPEVTNLFMKYEWPGNVRQFQHVLEHAFIRCHDDVIELQHLPPEIHQGEESTAAEPGDERQRIYAVLDRTDWNKAKAARLLGIDRKTLYRKMDRWNIAPERREA